MMICNPVPCEDRMVFRTQALSDAIGALGTDGFGTACFAVLEQAFDIDHWAIFRYRGFGAVHCIATASRDHVATARRNVDLFLTRCHRVDPSLLAFRQQRTTQSCLVKINVADISDAQYRNCFETTKVRERMSFFVAQWRRPPAAVHLSRGTAAHLLRHRDENLRNARRSRRERR